MPAIMDGVAAVVTRLSTAEFAPAPPLNWNTVVSPLAMLKLFQLMMARSLDWLIVRRLTPGVMTAVPLPTTPPLGLAKAPEMQKAKRERMPSECLVWILFIQKRAKGQGFSNVSERFLSYLSPARRRLARISRFTRAEDNLS